MYRPFEDEPLIAPDDLDTEEEFEQWVEKHKDPVMQKLSNENYFDVWVCTYYIWCFWPIFRIRPDRRTLGSIQTRPRSSFYLTKTDQKLKFKIQPVTDIAAGHSYPCPVLAESTRPWSGKLNTRSDHYHLISRPLLHISIYDWNQEQVSFQVDPEEDEYLIVAFCDEETPEGKAVFKLLEKLSQKNAEHAGQLEIVLIDPDEFPLMVDSWESMFGVEIEHEPVIGLVDISDVSAISARAKNKLGNSLCKICSIFSSWIPFFVDSRERIQLR